MVFGIDESFWRTHSWATPTSGLKIYERFAKIPRSDFSMSGIPAAQEAAVRAVFEAQILEPKDYSSWISLDIIFYLRKSPESVRKEFFAADQATLVCGNFFVMSGSDWNLPQLLLGIGR